MTKCLVISAHIFRVISGSDMLFYLGFIKISSKSNDQALKVTRKPNRYRVLRYQKKIHLFTNAHIKPSLLEDAGAQLYVVFVLNEAKL
jgi:hypothetical protein